jgi:hypothetical protein
MLAERVAIFVDQNPQIDLETVDLHDQEVLNGLTFDGHDHRETLAAVKAYQRVLRIAQSPDQAAELYAAGLDSAHSIAQHSERHFLAGHPELFGGDRKAQRAVYRAAVGVRTQTNHLWANIRALTGSRHYRAASHHVVSQSLIDYVQSIPSYQDLFGSLDYLSCDHCQSIFSPAAYFVDIMRVVEEYITYPNTTKPEGNIPPGMTLAARRPDLFDLPLTCGNTDTVIPFLRVVNEVLEAKVEGDIGKKPYRTVALAPYPFNLPFLLPLAQVRANLGALQTSLASVFVAYAAPLTAGVVAAATATSVTLDQSASATDGFYVGMELTITEGTGAGQTSHIAAYAGATRVATVTAYTVMPVAGARYQISDAMDIAREQLGLSREQWAYICTPNASDTAQSAAWGYKDILQHVYAYAPGAGTVTIAAKQTNVTGNGTDFDTYAVGDQFLCAGQIRTITVITSATELTVASPWTADATDATYQVARWSAGTGTVSVSATSTKVYGADTAFDTLAAADQIEVNGVVRTVVEIIDAVQLFVDTPFASDATGVGYRVNPTSMLERVSTFLTRTGLLREQLVAMLTQDMAPAEVLDGAADRLFINNTGEGLPPLQIVTDTSDPTSPYQRIVGLSMARLDRLNRFIRLAAWSGWGYADLDWMLIAAGDNGITPSALSALAAAKLLGTALKQPPQTITALWFDLKTTGWVTESDRQDLFDRVYNNPALLRGTNPYTNPTPIPFDPARPLDWKITERTSADAAIRSRLLGALAIGDDDLTRLGEFVGALVGAMAGTLTLNLANLTWLYRLTVQAKAYRLPVADLLTLLRLMNFPTQKLPPQGAAPATAAAALITQTTAAWVAASPFSVPELLYILTGEVSQGFKLGYSEIDLRRLIDRAATAAKDTRLTTESFVFADIDAFGSKLIFEALVAAGFLTALGIVLTKPLEYDNLAFTVPVTEKSFITQNIPAPESKAAFAALVAKGIVIAATGATTGTLARSFSVSSDISFLFDGDEVKIAEARRILLQIQQDINNVVQVIVDARAAQEGSAEQAVVAFLRIAQSLLAPLLAFTLGTITLDAYRAALLTPLLATAPVPVEVDALIATLSRANLWVAALAYTPAEVTTITSNPTPFGIASTRALALANLQTLAAFKTLTARFGEQTDKLFAYFAAQSSDRIALLAALSGWPPSQIARLFDTFWPPAAGIPTANGPATVAGLERLSEAFDLAAATGTDAFFMLALTDLLHLCVGPVSGPIDSAAYASYEAQAAGTLDALAGRLGANAFVTAYIEIEGTIDTAKRNALLPFTIWTLSAKFPFIETPANLYQFLLLDVEMCACATTSRIVQAISSVQLYMQRCRMNLEAGVTLIDVDPVWWDWLTAYRVWEANRLIFVYPENYLQPGLRSSQTPPFADFKQALSQSDLGDRSTTDAFLDYFQQLTELASMSFTGAHQTIERHASGDRDVLYAIARAGTDPYKYFYRTHDSLGDWSPWWKIDLSISSPYVTPVVAFGNLFLFWIELGTAKTATIAQTSAKNQYVVDATIKYSFLSVNDHWIQPQVLQSQIPIEVGPDDYLPLSDTQIKQILDTAGLAWRQPYALNVARGLVGTGRAIATTGLSNFDGTGTKFKSELSVGDTVYVGGERRTIKAVFSDTAAFVDEAWTVDAEDAEFKIIPWEPQRDGFPPAKGAGKVTLTKGLANVSGTGTKFKTAVVVGDRMLVGQEVRNIIYIQDDTDLLVDQAWNESVSDADYTIVPVPTGAEQLVVLYGGAVPTTNDVVYAEPDEPVNDGKDTFLAQKSDYDYSLFYTLKLATKAKKAYATAGEVTVGVSRQINSDLAANPSRILTLDGSYASPNAPRPFRLALSRQQQVLSVVESANAIYDNYWGSSAPGTLDIASNEGAHKLLFNIAPRHAVLLGIGNQPGEALFNNGDESFWVRATQPGLQKLSDMTFVRRVELDEPDTLGLLLSAGTYTSKPVDFATLDFSFVRTSTSVVAKLNQKLLAGGIPRLLTVDSQLTPELPFYRFYPIPTSKPPHVIPPESDVLDFAGAYGPYFREVFLFVPWYVADRLKGDRRFGAAKTWLEYVFNPTAPPEIGVSDAQRYWRFLPFRDMSPERLAAVLQNPVQIAAYNDHPFDPDAIAALRPSAYAKAVLLAYIRNLLAWGDALFAADTRESIDTATQLYTLAEALLGRRPQIVGSAVPPAPTTFRQIMAKYGQDIPQFIIDLENATTILGSGKAPAIAYAEVPINDIRAYFCVPENAELLAFWDLVEDRMYKIRHCMNLQGVVRSLALFAPPINPRDLIRAGAGAGEGLPRGTALPSQVPFYRFTTLIAKAQAVTGQVQQLGSALLAALEKGDAETLALLRSSQERAILDLTTLIKEQQIVEAQATSEALAESLTAATERKTHYQTLVDVGLIPEEVDNLRAMEAALVFNTLAGVATTASSIGYAIPQVGSPFAMTYGGIQIGSAVQAAAGVFQIGSIISQFIAQQSLTMAGYTRRGQDWQLQATLANVDEKQITAQIAANAARQQIVQRELIIHQQQLAQNAAIAQFMTTKFTNEQLYDWMAGRIAEVYYQAYQLAVDLARSAQRAYQFERGTNQTFLDFTYWDSLRKGLLAGEGLMQSLIQMDKAYVDANRRPLEINRTVSLLQLDPKALLDLKATGECVFAFPESLFDRDFPGHYRRTIASLDVSIPAVVGPFQNVKGTLTQLGNQVLLTPNVEGMQYLLGESATVPGPDVLRSNWWVNQGIALSRGVQDSGVFDPSPGDPRYLPFEGTGAVSSWRLSLPLAANHLAFETIADVVIQLRYAALDGGRAFRDVVVAQPSIQEYLGSPLLSFAQQYPDQWFAFIHERVDPTAQTLQFTVPPTIVPPHIDDPKLVGFYLVIQVAAGVKGALAANDYMTFDVTNSESVEFSPTPQFTYPHTFLSPIPLADVCAGTRTITFDLATTPAVLKRDGYLDPAVVHNIGLVLYYRGSIRWSSP